MHVTALDLNCIVQEIPCQKHLQIDGSAAELRI